MKRIAGNTCHRCGGKIPNTEHPGEYPGALSRVDNTTEVCSRCGVHEAMAALLGGQLDYTGWKVKP